MDSIDVVFDNINVAQGEAGMAEVSIHAVVLSQEAGSFEDLQGDSVVA